MAIKTYWEKLQDPRWQKLRLEVMQAKDFTCEICGDNKNSLNVHHKEYFKGHEPWEYETSQLSCLCKSCHENSHDRLDSLKWACSYLNMDGPKNRDDAAFLMAGFVGMDYQSFLCFTCFDDSEHKRQIFNLGVEASKSCQVTLS